MSDFKIVDESLEKIRNELNNYKTVYLDVSPQIGHLYVVKEFLKEITQKCAIVYLVNNVDSGESISYIKNYFKEVKKYKISTVYKNIEPNTITIISATEDNLDKKIKKLDSDCHILLINDCSLSLKSMTLNKINKLIAPTKILSLVYTPRLTEHELMTITTKEVGYIFIDANKDDTQKFVKGFMVNPSEELKEFDYDELPKRLIYCGYKKFIELNQILTTNGKLIRNQSLGIKYLIVVKNQAEAVKAKEYLYDYGNDNDTYISDEYDITNNRLDNNDADVIIAYGNRFLETENMEKFQVITMLENTCSPNTLFELTKKVFKNEVISDDEQYGYKYLYLYDTPDVIKKSLIPSFIKPSTTLISNDFRNGVKQITVSCSGLESVKYRDIEDNNENRELFVKIAKKYSRKFSNISNIKEKQPILIDSFIKAYNNYDFNIGYAIDVNPEELECEARGLINKFISNTILSEELKISRESRNMICDYAMSLIKYRPDFDNVDMSIAIVNDMKNINFSITGKIVADFIIEYCKKHKEKIETRKLVQKYAFIPAITPENGNIKASEYFKAKKCAYTYGKKLNPETEKQFMNYLENSSFVEWWTKNGDLGQANFSVSCVDKKGLPQGFYPDWIIKIKDKRLDKDVYLIVDTKAGMTLDDSGLTGAKIKALQEWCDNYNKNNEIQFWCGIITFVNGFWQISSNNFDYIIDMNYSNFVKFEDWLEQKIKAA